jgi:hypothetical protein
MAEYQMPQQAQAMPTGPRRTWIKPLIAALILVAIAVGSFFIGVGFESGRKSPASNAGSQAQPQQQAPQQFNQGNGPFSGRRATGAVTAISPSSISVKTARSGSSSTYGITSSTVIQDNGQSASVSDIKVGDTVMIITDTSQPDVARWIIVNPQNLRNGDNSGPAR